MHQKAPPTRRHQRHHKTPEAPARCTKRRRNQNAPESTTGTSTRHQKASVSATWKGRYLGVPGASPGRHQRAAKAPEGTTSFVRCACAWQSRTQSQEFAHADAHQHTTNAAVQWTADLGLGPDVRFMHICVTCKIYVRDACEMTERISPMCA